MHTRVSAYAYALHDGHVLLTQLAAHCTRGGHWTLPGGGLDHGEQPVTALMREVFEETALEASEVELLHVRSFSEDTHRGPYMGVQIVYRATVRGEPRVVEVGGSTAAVRWVPLEELSEILLVPMVTALLEKHPPGHERLGR